MPAGLIAALASGGALALAALVVGAIALLRGGLGPLAPKHRPDSELGRAAEEIQAQIDAGRGGGGGLRW